MTISEFIKKHNITMHSVKVNQNPNMDDDKWQKQASHYEVTFRRMVGHTEKKLTTYFSMGSALKKAPRSDEVLDCLISDSDVLQYGFEDFCANLGYDTDSRKALKTYEICKSQGEKLGNFLDADLMQELQDCERL